jgi:hypothetical protein
LAGVTAAPGPAQVGAGRRARGVARVLRFVLRAVLGVIAAALTFALLAELAAAGAAWRLAQGPVPAGALLRRTNALPPGVVVGDVSLSWAGWRGGPTEPVQVRARDLRVAQPAGAALSIADGEATLALAPLLRGVVAPVTVRVVGLEARLGTQGREQEPAPSWLDIGALRDLEARDVGLSGTLPPASSGAAGLEWSARIASADVRQDADGAATGAAAVAVTVGGVMIPVQARVARAADQTLRIAVQAAEVRPAALAGLSPALASLAALDAPVALSADAQLTADYHPVRVAVQASAGAGTATLAGETAAISAATAEGALTWDGDSLHEAALTRLNITLSSPSGIAPTALQLAATATPGGDGGWRVQGRVGFDQVAFADLPRLWPPEAIRNARRWVIENITAGTARDAQFEATVDVPANADDAQLTAISGGLQAYDLTVHWLRPVPPAEHARATLVFVDPDTIRVAIAGADQGAVRVRSGTVALTGLAQKDQFADVALDLAGPLAAIVAVLKHPRLHLLSKDPLPFTVAAGQVAGALDVRIPLLDDLDADSIGLKARMKLADVALHGVVAGRDLTRGALDLDVTNDGLRLGGRAVLAGIPAQLGVTADFRAGPPSEVLVAADVTGRVTPAALAGAGLDAAGVFAGAGTVSVHYAQRRDKQAAVAVRADLGDAAVSLPIWRKPAGVPATASARAKLQNGRLVAVDELHAQGPGLLVAARAEMVGGRPSVLKLDQVVLDRTEAAGEVRLPPACGGAYCVRLAGPTLDLSTGLGRIARTPSGGATGKGAGPPWRADLRFGRVLLDETHALGPVRADATSNGARLVTATLDAPGVRGTLRPQGRSRVATVRAADLGGLLRGIGTTDLLHGGRFALDGRFDDARPGSPFSATAELHDFTVQRAVVAGKVLQALTLYGILEAIRGPGLFFARAVVPMRYAGSTLDLGPSRASSAALGVTAQGRLDFARRIADLRGTIVPAYAVNAALGRLPGIGRLFSPERGGGLFAADFTLRGPLDDPRVSVNPLSLLTPGALRGIFK